MSEQPAYPTRAEQMQASDPIYIEKDEVHQAAYAVGTNLYPLPVTASHLDKVLVKQRMRADSVAHVPGDHSFWLPNADPAPTPEDVILVNEDGEALDTPKAVTVAYEVVDDVPGFTVVVTWETPGDPGPVDGQTIYLEFQAMAELADAALAGVNAANIAACDTSRITGDTLTILYRSNVKPLFTSS